MVRRFFVVFALILFSLQLPAQTISTYKASSSSSARIVVRAGERAAYRIPRTDYGTFLEDIGNSVFGGVSAQLLDNPSFEAYNASLSTLKHRFSSHTFLESTMMGLPLPWLPLYPDEGWRYEPRWGHAANSERYLYVMGLNGKEVGIRQTIYLPIERELAYRGILFASSAEGRQTLEVSFRRLNRPDAVLASAQVSAPALPGWHKLAFQLTIPANSVAPLEPVDFCVSIRGNRRISLDEIRLYPDDAVDGLDPAVIRAAKALHSPLLRYGGNFTSGYHWQNGIGPLDSRPTTLNQAWGIPEYNLFGTDELMEFCRLIGARAQICLNLGSGSANEARKWVEYCQGSADSPEGKIRARNGHPAPYPVAAWELGNELWGHFQIGFQTPDGYAARYRQFYNAIRGLVPPGAMIFANGADIDHSPGWNEALINQDGKELNYLTSHFVVGMDDVVNKSAGRNFIWAADLAIPVGIGRELKRVEDQINANPATRGRVKLAYTEWLFTASKGSPYPRWSNLGGALVCAGWMNMLLEHADFVPVSDMTGLVDFAGIHKRRGRVYVTPQYWAFWLYSNFAGDTPVKTETMTPEYSVMDGVSRIPNIPHTPYLDVLATRDSHYRTLTLFVVNRDWEHSIQTNVDLRNFNPAPDAVVRTLTADSMLASNDEAHPVRVRPAKTVLKIPGSNFNYVFPKHSITVLTFTPR